MDYLHLVDLLAQERAVWLERRGDADRELTRLADLIRAAVRMLPPEQESIGERILARLDHRPAGLSQMIRLALSDGAWLTPLDIRAFLTKNGFWFGAYTSNPQASIHTTLRRMVPELVETKRGRDGRRVYRLKRGEPLERARTGAARLRAVRDTNIDGAPGR